jgi:expansin
MEGGPMRRRRLIVWALTVSLLALVAVVVVALRGPGGLPETTHTFSVSMRSPVPITVPTGSTSAAPTVEPTPTPTPTAAPTAAPAQGQPATTGSHGGQITPGTTYTGIATWYHADGSGACLFDAGGDPMTAAMNWSDYGTSQACGAYLLVRSSSGATVTVRVTNLCPAPCQVHQLDLSPEAFAALADPSTGQISVTWSLLSPSINGGMSIRYKDGSSQYWCGIQVINHRNPVARLDVLVGGSWRQLTRTDYNYFLSPDGGGCGSQVRVTDIYGESVVTSALPVQPGVTQPTSLQFAQH